MVRLTVAIITYNEEENIERCIRSVLPVADEVVVVDSFSKDKTEQICRALNITFLQHSFEGHIQQKNYAIEKSSGEYVLSLDADEELSESLKDSILAEKQKGFSAKCYQFNRLSNYCGHWVKYCGWYPDTKVRLIKKNFAKWGGTNPHDELIPSTSERVVHLKGDLLHYTIKSREQHLKQVEYFSTIGAQEAFKKGKPSNFFIILTKTIFKFFRDYIIKLGFLDGKTGFLISSISAFATYKKYQKLRDLHRVKNV